MDAFAGARVCMYACMRARSNAFLQDRVVSLIFFPGLPSLFLQSRESIVDELFFFFVTNNISRFAMW